MNVLEKLWHLSFPSLRSSVSLLFFPVATQCAANEVCCTIGLGGVFVCSRTHGRGRGFGKTRAHTQWATWIGPRWCSLSVSSDLWPINLCRDVTRTRAWSGGITEADPTLWWTVIRPSAAGLWGRLFFTRASLWADTPHSQEWDIMMIYDWQLNWRPHY